MTIAPVDASAIEHSRLALLEAIGPSEDLTLVRRWASLEDELSAAGARALLGDRPLKVLDPCELTAHRGDTVLLEGGGFCRPDHDVMPRVLAIAGMRFKRVIVMPGYFDASDDVVRAALRSTRASVFACEPESHAQIASLCDAHVAHDCAFFFDFAGQMRQRGVGTLNAFRDGGYLAQGGWPQENSDVAAVCEDLPAFLEVIRAHAVVRTDRARVMIAAALLGKRVEYAVSEFHALGALAQFALSDLPVIEIDPRDAAASDTAPATLDVQAEQTLRKLTAAGQPARRRKSAGSDRITAVILTRDRPRLAQRALNSLNHGGERVQTIVIDNNSGPRAASLLAKVCERHPWIELRRREQNLGCGGGRRYGTSLVDTELVLLLDDDAELLPGALEQLTDELDRHPGAGAVSATVVSADGTIMHSGGLLAKTAETVRFGLIGHRQQFGQAPLPPSGPAGWVPGTAMLARRELFDAFPIEDSMAYFEDNEWCYRVGLERPGSFLRSREALALHNQPGIKPELWPDFRGRSRAVEWLRAHAIFYRRHGLLMDMVLFELVPELRAHDGTRDLPGARLLLDLVASRGTDWVLMEWLNGQLGGLLRANRSL